MKPLGLFWGNVSVVLHVMLTDTRHSSLWWARFTKVKTNRTNNQRLKNTQIKPKPPPSPHFTCQPVWLSMAKAHKSSMRFGEEHCWGPIAIISWNLCLVIKSWENWLHNLFLESESTNLQGNCLQLGTPKKRELLQMECTTFRNNDLGFACGQYWCSHRLILIGNWFWGPLNSTKVSPKATSTLHQKSWRWWTSMH